MGSQLGARPPGEPLAAAIVLEYTADRRITINKQPVALQELEARLPDVYTARGDRTLYVVGDGPCDMGTSRRSSTRRRGRGSTGSA
jgi:biopolymer transport protein ExbD